VSEHIVNIDETNAAALLIEESHNRPVVVDFWADWCEPCKVLMPMLEKIAEEYNGAFLLAKVNADEQGMIAQQFGVRSLPTVMVIQNGQPVDGFAGAQPENAVREMLGRVAEFVQRRPQPLNRLQTLRAHQHRAEDRGCDHDRERGPKTDRTADLDEQGDLDQRYSEKQGEEPHNILVFRARGAVDSRRCPPYIWRASEQNHRGFAERGITWALPSSSSWSWPGSLSS